MEDSYYEEKNNCIFIVYKKPFGQTSPNILNYVYKNYDNCGEIPPDRYYFCNKKINKVWCYL